MFSASEEQASTKGTAMTTVEIQAACEAAGIKFVDDANFLRLCTFLMDEANSTWNLSPADIALCYKFGLLSN